MDSIPKRATFAAAMLLALAQLLTYGAVQPVAAVGEIRVDVCLTDSGSSVLVPGTTFYRIGAGPISAFDTTVDGTTSCKYDQVHFPAGTTNVTIWTTYNNTASAHVTQDISSTPVFNFQTSSITVRVQDASSAGVAGAQVRFGASGSGGGTYYYPGQPTGASGDVAAELFPGTYDFNVGLNHTSMTKTQNVGSDPLVVFTTTTLTFGYSGVISFGGSGSAGYFTPPLSRELFPGTVNFQFRFPPGGPITLPITIDGVALTKSMIVARLLDPSANPISGVAVSAQPGSISLGTTDANGVAYALVDGTLGSETVSFTYGAANFSLTQDQPTNSIYRFVVDAPALDPPTVTPNITGTLGNNGWYVSDVTVSWTLGGGPADSTSGCDTTLVTSDTSGTTFTCSATNLAGSDTKSVTIKRDATAPVLNPSVSPDPVLHNAAATADAGASDSTSGIAAASCDPVDTSSLGPQAVDCSATDNAGNSSTGTATYLVYALGPGGGMFVVGDESATGSVYFWGSKWAKSNALSGGSAPSAFKGYAGQPVALVCGSTWSSGPGNAAQPSVGPLPEYMAVLVASSATKSGSQIAGDVIHIVIVKTDSGYDGNPGHPGTGTVVATIC